MKNIIIVFIIIIIIVLTIQYNYKEEFTTSSPISLLPNDLPNIFAILFPDASGVLLNLNQKLFSQTGNFYMDLSNYRAGLNIHLSDNFSFITYCLAPKKRIISSKTNGVFNFDNTTEPNLVRYHGDSIIYSNYNPNLSSTYYDAVNTYINQTKANVKLVLTTNSKQKIANICVTDGNVIYWVSTNFNIDPAKKLCMCLVETKIPGSDTITVLLCVYQYTNIFDFQNPGIPVWMTNAYIPVNFNCNPVPTIDGSFFKAPKMILPGYWAPDLSKSKYIPSV